MLGSSSLLSEQQNRYLTLDLPYQVSAIIFKAPKNI